jgi:hypothetical protein
MHLHVIWKTPTSFAVFEIVVVILFLMTCWHATQMPRFQRVELLTAVLYALLFEELDIRLFKTYHYGAGYALMLGHVPLVIALAWAVIISTSMHISDCWPLSALARACCDALLALLIDLSIDAIAIRRGYWQWTIPLNAGWFGVPADNLSAWMFVVFFFSLLCRLLRRLSAQHRAMLCLIVLVPPLAYLGLFLSLVALGTVNALLQLDENTKLCSTLAVAVGMLVGGLRSRVRSKARSRTTRAPIIAGIRLCLHGFFVLELLASGLFLTLPLLLVVALSALLLDLALHRVTYP